MIHEPPVNVLSAAVRQALIDEFQKFGADPEVKAIVLICGGRTFIAGFDITEFRSGLKDPPLSRVLNVVENVGKPVIAAIHGTALGGGFELAMLCSHRVAVPSASVGLPEVRLGLLPAAGGTQRLPRMVGPAVALEILTSGRPVGSPEALELGLLDAVVTEGQLEHQAVAFARRVVAEGGPLPRVRDRQELVDPFRGKPELFAEFRTRKAAEFRGFKAPEAIIQAVEAAVELPIEAGLAREQALIAELLASRECAAQRHLFFAERRTSKIPDVATDTRRASIRSVAVIGGGAAGGDIALHFLNSGIPVTLRDTGEALERSVTGIRRAYASEAAKGRMDRNTIEARMDLVSASTDIFGPIDSDLVICAAPAEPGTRKDWLKTIAGIAHPDAILGITDLFPDLDDIAVASGRPEQVIGLRFFPHGACLIEVVRGGRSHDESIATVMSLARRIGKVPVLCRPCRGLIADRIADALAAEVLALLNEGMSIETIDRALGEYGFVSGYLARTRPGVLERHQDGSAIAGAPQRSAIMADEIAARLLYPVVNEAAKLLDEGIAIRASDIDVAAVLALDWPVYTGGPLFWADTVGLPEIMAWLNAACGRHGARFSPSQTLERLASEGRGFAG